MTYVSEYFLKRIVALSERVGGETETIRKTMCFGVNKNKDVLFIRKIAGYGDWVVNGMIKGFRDKPGIMKIQWLYAMGAGDWKYSVQESLLSAFAAHAKSNGINRLTVAPYEQEVADFEKLGFFVSSACNNMAKEL